MTPQILSIHLGIVTDVTIQIFLNQVLFTQNVGQVGRVALGAWVDISFMFIDLFTQAGPTAAFVPSGSGWGCFSLSGIVVVWVLE